MLDRLRFQEIEKAIFKVREDGNYGNKHYCKGEPFLVIDNASMSNFNILENSKPVVGRSTEGNTTMIEGVNFNLSNGQILLNLFNTIHGDVQHRTQSFGTVIGVSSLIDNDEIILPSAPIGDVVLYLTDEYGDLQKIAKTHIISIEENKITLNKKVTKDITYVYEEQVDINTLASIGQLGKELILSLELQCKAMDILTEEHFNIFMKFPKVVVGTELGINFNNSNKASGSVIYVQALPEDLQGKVNKTIFEIEVLSNE